MDWKIGDTFYDLSPNRSSNDILYKITKIFTADDKEVKDGTQNIGDIVYECADGSIGGGIAPAHQANYNFSKSSGRSPLF